MAHEAGTASVLRQLRALAAAHDGKETLALLTGIRKIVIELNAASFFGAEDVAATDIAFLYILSKFVDDLWFNLCVDASFDFPEQSPSIKSVGEHLRQFLVCTPPTLDTALKVFGEAVASYYEFVSQKNLQLEQSVGSGAI